jgi:signal transduction histidine kinase
MAAADDPRIGKLIEATRTLRDGGFDVTIEAEGDDQIAELAEALAGLGRHLQQRCDEVDRLAAVVEAVNSGIYLDEVVEYIFDAFRPIIPYDRIGLALVSEDGKEVRARWACSDVPEIKLGPGYSSSMEGSSLAQIIETGQPRILNDLERYLAEHPDSEGTRLIVEEGMRSSLTCPLISQGRPIGFLFFSSKEPNTYRDIHQGLFLRLANQVSMIVEKSRLLEATVDVNRELELANVLLDSAREEAEAAKRVAEEAVRMRSRFFASVSHDIRTPMSGIIGMTDLALMTDLDDEQREYLEIVKSSADSLLTLLNDLLDLSKIEAGRLELAAIEFDLREVLRGSLATHSVPADTKGLELNEHVDDEVPERLLGDPDRLRQIVNNLVNNAIKFTDQGRILLAVRLETPKSSADPAPSEATGAAPENQLRLHFSVADTGIGVPAEKREVIFGAFEQAHESADRATGGVGLGLAICRRLVQRMDGEIWVESEIGQGSTFHFTARFAVSEPSGARASG